MLKVLLSLGWEDWVTLAFFGMLTAAALKLTFYLHGELQRAISCFAP